MKLKAALIAFHHLPGSHTGANIAQVVLGLLDRAGITDKVSPSHLLVPFAAHCQIGHFTLNNAANNNTMLSELSRLLKNRDILFDSQDLRIMCLPHILNICAKHATDDFTSADFSSISGESFQFPRGNVDKHTYLEALNRDPFARARDVVRVVRSSNLRRESLREIVLDGNNKKYWRNEDNEVEILPLLELIRDVPTRWDSKRSMAERLRMYHEVC